MHPFIVLASLLALAFLSSCTEQPAADDDDATEPLPFQADCSAIDVEPTVCSGHPGNAGAWLRGQVVLSEALLAGDVTEGDLVVVLTHSNLGNAEAGGYLHTATAAAGVDLALEPADFAFDMCAGGEMFSEENCAYNLVAILDQNGNNGPNNFVPDPGEPATIVTDLWISCMSESPCFTLELDCTDGASCVEFTNPGNCACEGGCNSEIVTCE